MRRHRLSFLEPPPPSSMLREESRGNRKLGENRFLTTIPDRSPLPATPLKSLRAIRKARHRSCEAVLGPSTSPYLLDTRFNSESRFTAPTVYATVFNNASTLVPRFPSPSSPTKNPRKKNIPPIFLQFSLVERNNVQKEEHGIPANR